MMEAQPLTIVQVCLKKQQASDLLDGDPLAATEWKLLQSSVIVCLERKTKLNIYDEITLSSVFTCAAVSNNYMCSPSFCFIYI